MIRLSLNVAYLLLTGVILIAIAISFLVYRPMLATLAEERQQGQKAEQELTERRDFLAGLEGKKKALDSQQTNEHILSVALPETDEIDSVLRIVNQAAITAGGTIKNFQNTTVDEQRNARIKEEQQPGTQPSGQIVSLGAHLDFTGSYQQLRVFLGELEKSPRLIDVLEMNVANSDTTVDSLTATLTLRFYRYGTTAK